MVEPQQAAGMMQQPTEGEYAGPYSCMHPIGQNHQQEKQKQHSPFVSTGQRQALIYEGSQQPIEEKAKQPLPRSNPISELNSLPGQWWPKDMDRCARLCPQLDDDESISIFAKFAKFVPPLPHLPSFSRLIG
jgi:hypothetical protein